MNIDDCLSVIIVMSVRLVRKSQQILGKIFGSYVFTNQHRRNGQVQLDKIAHAHPIVMVCHVIMHENVIFVHTLL